VFQGGTPKEVRSGWQVMPSKVNTQSTSAGCMGKEIHQMLCLHNIGINIKTVLSTKEAHLAKKNKTFANFDVAEQTSQHKTIVVGRRVVSLTLHNSHSHTLNKY
jgi:hypothetical protein